MNANSELYRLIELMPASGRMFTKLASKSGQPEVILAQYPPPWEQTRHITINMTLWNQLPQPQRDLLLLRTVAWVMAIQWFKLDVYQGLVAAGLAGTFLELVRLDPVGIVTVGGLTALAGAQIWRKSRSIQTELQADEKAVQVAQRRGYTEIDSARHLADAIESAAQLEQRASLRFNELVRCQNLRAIAGLSPIQVPEPLGNE
jgi:hypothetical protein